MERGALRISVGWLLVRRRQGARLAWWLMALGARRCARYLCLGMPVADGLPLQANPGARWSQAAPLLYDLCFLKAKPRQRLHRISRTRSSQTSPQGPHYATGAARAPGASGDGGSPSPLPLHQLLRCCKGRRGRTISDHSPCVASLQQSWRGKPLRQSPALPFLLAQGTPAAPGVGTNQPRHAPAFP